MCIYIYVCVCSIQDLGLDVATERHMVSFDSAAKAMFGTDAPANSSTVNSCVRCQNQSWRRWEPLLQEALTPSTPSRPRKGLKGLRCLLNKGLLPGARPTPKEPIDPQKGLGDGYIYIYTHHIIWGYDRIWCFVLVLQSAEARKCEHERPPISDAKGRGKTQQRSSFIHAPAFWS